MHVSQIRDCIQDLECHRQGKQTTSALSVLVETLGKYYLDGAVSYQPPFLSLWSPNWNDLQLASVQRILADLSKKDKLSSVEKKACLRLLRIVKVTSLAVKLHSGEQTLELVDELMGLIFTPKFILASQADPKRREILFATKGLIPALKAISNPSLQRKITFLTTLIRLITVQPLLFCNPAYHGPAALLLFYDLSPQAFDSSDTLDEALGLFFKNYVEHYAMSRDSYLIMPALPLDGVTLNVWFDQSQYPLSFKEPYFKLNGAHSEQDKDLGKLLMRCFPGVSAGTPVYLFPHESVNSHPVAYIREMHNRAYTLIEKECLPEEMNSSVIRHQMRLGLQADYNDWKVAPFQASVCYLIQRTALPFFNAVIRSSQGPVTTHLFAYDCHTGLFQWQEGSYPAARSVAELIDQLHPRTAIIPMIQLQSDVEKFLKWRRNRFSRPTQEMAPVYPEEYSTLLQSQDLSAKKAAVVKLLQGLFSCSSIVRSLEVPSLRELLHQSRKLAVRLEAISTAELAEADAILFNFLHDLVIAVSVPTDLYLDAGYHGAAFLFWAYEKQPQVFAQSGKKRQEALSTLIVKEYFPNFQSRNSYSGYLVLPEILSTNITTVNIYSLMHPWKKASYAEGMWQVAAPGSRQFRDFAALIRSDGYILPKAAPYYPVRVGDMLQENLPDQPTSDLQVYANFAFSHLPEASYCLIPAHSQHAYYLLVNDRNGLKRDLLVHNPVTGSYTMTNKKRSGFGTIPELLDRLYPNLQLTRARATMPRPPRERQAAVDEGDDL